jgi:hypothetical protein
VVIDHVCRLVPEAIVSSGAISGLVTIRRVPALVLPTQPLAVLMSPRSHPRKLLREAVDDAALLAVDALDLPGYLPYHLTRAELLVRTGRTVEAREAYDGALALATNAVEREHVARRRARAAPPASAAPSGG